MSGLITSVAEERPKWSYQAIHRPDCPQVRRLAKTTEVPPEMVRYFHPCGWCFERGELWERVPPPDDESALRWYRAARLAVGEAT